MSPSVDSSNPLTRQDGMAARIRDHDWSDFQGGAIDAWPRSLRHTVDLMLNTKFPVFVLWGEQLQMLYNDAYSVILDGKHPAAFGKPIPEVWSELWDQIKPIIDKTLKGEPSFFENMPIYLNRNGAFEQTYFTFSYSPLRSDTDNIEGLLCICHETTGTVVAHDMRQTENERLLQLFSQSPGFLAVMRGPQHIIEMENEAYSILVGHRKVLGKPLAEAVPETVDQEFIHLMDEVYRTGVAFVGRSIRYDGARNPGKALEEMYIDLVFQPIFDEQKKVTGIMVQGSEVTEQYRARQALLDADRQKDQFIATLAHELRNPLAPIRAATRLLQSPELTRSALDRTTQVISRQVEHMAKLLDDLLDVARISNNQIRLTKERLSVDALIDFAIEAARPLLDTKKHKLMVHHAGDIYIEADKVRIKQVLSNLICNAAKYTDPGGTITVGAEREPGTCIITVRDTGVGITPAALNNIFVMFSQEEAALDRSDGGLGIGLGLVKALVELHGGSVCAESAGAGKGSTFKVTLPCRVRGFEIAEQAPRPPPPAAIVLPANPASTILVADDNIDLLDILARFLEMLGHRVLSATGGTKALALCEAEHPDIAILDIGMPDMNGFEVAQAIRAQPWGADIFLVAATGWGSTEDRDKTHSAGFNAHLTKPFAMEKLEEVLRRALV